MKKTVVFLFVVLLALSLLCACSKEEKENKPVEQEDYSEYFLTARSEAELCYLSYFGCDGFGSYIMAYPDSAIEYFAASENMSREMFEKKVEDACQSLGDDRLAVYGKEYDVGYNSILDEKIEGEALDSLKNSLEKYGIEKDSIKEAVRGHYSYAYFTRVEREVKEDGTTDYEFGVIPEDAEILYQSTAVITLINIDGQGWYVSPEEFVAE